MLAQPVWERHPWCPGCCSSSAARKRGREKTPSGAGRATAGMPALGPNLWHLCSLVQSRVGEVSFGCFLAAGGFPVELRRQQRAAEHRLHPGGPQTSRGRGGDPAEVILSGPAWAIGEREAEREEWRSSCCSESPGPKSTHPPPCTLRSPRPDVPSQTTPLGQRQSWFLWMIPGFSPRDLH